MLTSKGYFAFTQFLSLGCSLKLFPYEWDKSLQRLKPGGRSNYIGFNLHKALMFFITFFSCFRLIQGMNRGYFPLLLKILNMVWFMAYVLTSIALLQFQLKGAEILQFANNMLAYMSKDLRRAEKLMEEGTSKKSSQKYSNGNKLKTLHEQERKSAIVLTRYLILGLFMLASNPSIHILLVDESPCAPHFSSSLFFPCEGFKVQGFEIPLLHKAPFMIIEYYFTTVMFSSLSINWSIIFLGLSWIVTELRRMCNSLYKKRGPTVLHFRSVECIATLLNDAFILYLSAFPTLLFAIVSVLAFGVIRIWHYHPGSNLMFPLCAVRCGFEAVTPLGVAGDVNDKNKEVLSKWKELLSRRKKKNQDLLRTYLRSFHGVRCTAGALYTFENSIVLCCINNCIQLTLNMLVTFG